MHDPPGLEVRDDLFDDVADLVDLLIEFLLPIQEFAAFGLLEGVIMLLPTYPLSPSQLRGSTERRAPDSPRQWLSWRLPEIGSEIHARHPVMVQATCTFIPVVLCFPEYSSGAPSTTSTGAVCRPRCTQVRR